MAWRGPGGWVTLALIAGVLSAPLVVFAGLFGLRFGWWGLEVALDLLGVTVAPWLLGLGAICALMLLWRGRRAGVPGWLTGVASLVLVTGGVVLYAGHVLRQSPEPPPPLDVSTSPGEPPGFSTRLSGFHSGPAGAACPGVASLPTQIRAEDASEALRRAGFTPVPSSLFRVEGTHEGMWFLLRHDAIIRIRPGRTDVRVAARSDRPQGDETCRLLARIVAELQPRR